MATPLLTIAIPTYNRAAKLKVQIERLLPQIGPEIRLCIYDNASPDGTQEIVEPYISLGVSYFRAATNCGAGRNIFRCFEECQTEWLWVLSDDDPISSTAISDLLSLLHTQTCDLIHTSTADRTYDSDLILSDIASLFDYTNFGSLLWISPAIYRTASFVPLFRMYNESISTWGPHLIMILALLESHGGKVLLSPLRLIPDPSDPAHAWSTLDCILRLSQIPAYLTQPSNQKLLAERIFVEWFDGAFLKGLREIKHSTDIYRWRRIYSQAKFNLKSYGAQGAWGFFLHNWFRAGYRRCALNNFRQAFMLGLLRWCPVVLFDLMLAILPLPLSLRKFYKSRKEFTPCA
ncbi:MAG: glycosyltransferase family 2 protein [Chthoniobacteraceae bacterium]